MALFRIFKGNSNKLGTAPTSGQQDTRYAHEGFAYFTPDDGKFYIDIAGTNSGTETLADSDFDSNNRNRVPISAEKADRDIDGDFINETYAAGITINNSDNIVLLNKDGDQLTDDVIGTTSVDTVGIDTTVTENSTNLITSGAVYDFLDDNINYPVTSVNGQTGAVTISDSDEKLKTNTVGTGIYYLLSGNLTSNAETKYHSGNLRYQHQTNIDSIQIGQVSNGSTSKGRLTLCSGAYYTYLDPPLYSSIDSNKTYTLPTSSGTLALTSDIPSVPSWAMQSTKPTYTANEVGAVATSAVGAASGVAPLNASSKIDSTYLPSYVDDVIEGYFNSSDSKFYSSLSGTTYSNLITGESGKIYVDLTENKTYRYSGSTFIEITSSSLVTASADLSSGTKIGTITINGSNTNFYAPNVLPSQSGNSGKFLTTDGNVVSWATDNDTKNTAGSTDTSSKIYLIGATSQAANPQTYSDNEVYATSGVLSAKTFSGTNAELQNIKMVTILTAITSGRGDLGSNANPRYLPYEWYASLGHDPVDGEIIVIKTPSAGNTASVYLSINGNTDAKYHPIAIGGTNRITTHFASGTILMLVYESSMTVSTYALAGANSTSTITGIWRVLNFYDSNTNTLLRTYKATNSIELPILLRNSAASQTAANASISTYSDSYGAIAGTNTPTINPSTGKVTATGGFSGTINDITLTKASTGFTIAGGTTSKTLTVNNTYTLGAACEKGVDTTVTSGSANLITSGGAYTAIHNSTDVFVAISGVTTYNEIATAIAENKIIFVNAYGSGHQAPRESGWFYFIDSATANSSAVYLDSFGPVQTVSFICTNNNEWSTSTSDNSSTSSNFGHVTLSDSTSSTSSTSGGIAATPAAVKAAYDLANGKQAKITASGILKGDGSGGVTAATAGTDYAAASHAHGNITSGGDITATAPTIANGDQLIINDHSASKITNGPTFDGSTTTSYLSQKGTWESIPDASTSQKGILQFTSSNTNSQLATLPTWTATPTDDTYLIRRDTGGSASFGQIKFSTIWSYISGKITNGIYWADIAATSAAAYNKSPEMATIKLNGDSSASAASTKNVVLQYDSTLEALNFVFT